ncbi:MAG TPA: hypothetical protein VJI97_01635 [Candidatus Nanoarchaeia archaeon]|nr:hypothetical protein [Candidatus Nanoarchaeia archaeon]
MEKTDFNKNLNSYLKSRRKQNAGWIGKSSFFGKKKDGADIPEEAVKKLLASNPKYAANDDDSADENGTGDAIQQIQAKKETHFEAPLPSDKPIITEKTEKSPEEIKFIEEKNKDAAELMGAIESVLSLLPENEKLQFNESEELKNFRKNIESIKKNHN